MTKFSGLEKSLLQNQKRILETRLKNCLNQRIQALNNLSAIEKDELKDSTDLASAVLDQETNRIRANGCAKEIISVSQAILAIKNNTYGICENCEQLISRKRLEAVPWAIKCIDCQKAEESY